MSREPLPEALRRFVVLSIPSVPFVEALLLLRAAREPLATEAVARRLYMPEHSALQLLGQLHESRIVRPGPSEGTHRYAPDEDLAGALELLARFYSTHLVDVTQLIHSRSARKAQQFADAFKIRKDS
jgi:hypothetical protein